jgi:hypothetical protein
VGGVLDALTKKQPKPRGFRFVPRYYNAEKEAFKQRLEKIRTERDAKEDGTYVPNFKGKFSTHARKTSSVQKQIATYNMKLFVILVIVGIIGYYVSNTGIIRQGIEKILTVLTKKDGLY